MEISNDGSVSGRRGTADCDRQARLVIAIGDFHTAEPFPDSLASMQQRRGESDQVQTILVVLSWTLVSPLALTVKCACSFTNALDPSDPRATA